MDAHGDHREGGARLLGGHKPEDHGEEHAGQAAHQRDEHQRNLQATLAAHVHCVDGKERAEADIDRVAEAQHAALPQQDVVAQADDDEIAHLREHRECQAALEQERRDDQHDGKKRPDQVAADVPGLEAVVLHFLRTLCALHALLVLGGGCGCCGHGVSPPGFQEDPWA
jgi:hypothetical protein